MKKVISVMVMLLSLVGCQQVAKQKHEYVRNRGKDYLTSFAIAPLEIPPELSHPTPTENFPLPEGIPALGKVGPVSLVPPGFGIIVEEVES